MKAVDIIKRYISFFKKRGHKQIENSSLVPQNDPTTLFTSSGMQPLVPYLLGERHSAGKRLVNVQNSFRAQDIEEVGDNRHTTFFRMIGNWSLGDYFKSEQIPWFFEFLTNELGLDPKKLFITVFEGNVEVPRDQESIDIWTGIFTKIGLKPKEKIFTYGVEKNWWSRSGIPSNMPSGEPGGPDSEVFYDFGPELKIHENSIFKKVTCHPNCDCGRFMEIGNSVFMQYKKFDEKTFEQLPKQNVDFGGGLERLVAATENTHDIFRTSLFSPIILKIEKETSLSYATYARNMRIAADHIIASIFIAANNVSPSNKEQGYILRRLIRRGLDHFYELHGKYIMPVVESIVEQYRDTDPVLVEKFDHIKGVILEEEQKYQKARERAKKYIEKKYVKETNILLEGDRMDTFRMDGGNKVGDELMGTTEISADDAFSLYATHGLSPTQIKSLGYSFNEQVFSDKMKAHKDLSRTASVGKFKGGLADKEELTIKGHTATHLLQQALRDVLGNHVFQTGSNITTERLRFDFSHNKKLTAEQIEKVEEIVKLKILEDLPVHFEMMSVANAKKIGAIGLFDKKYQEKVKVYFIGNYSREFCGGPHVEHTNLIKSFKITKQEKLGQGQMRIYAVAG